MLRSHRRITILSSASHQSLARILGMPKRREICVDHGITIIGDDKLIGAERLEDGTVRITTRKDYEPGRNRAERRSG